MLRYEGAGAGHEEEGKDPSVTSLFSSDQLLVQAAEWKLQAKTLTQQATVMQAQVNTRRAPGTAHLGAPTEAPLTRCNEHQLHVGCCVHTQSHVEVI